MSPPVNRPSPARVPVPLRLVPAVLPNPVNCTTCGSQANDHKSPCGCACHFDIVGHAYAPDPTGRYPNECDQWITHGPSAATCACGYPPEKHR